MQNPRKLRRPVAALALSSVAIAIAVAAPAANAAPSTRSLLLGSAAGSSASASNGSVSSSPTAPTGVDTFSSGRQNSNTAAAGSSSGGLSVGGVTTSVSTSTVTDGLAVTSQAKTSGINLLSGAVTATSATTTARTTYAKGTATTAITTTFSGLKVRGSSTSRSPAKNTRVTLPDGAGTVVLNYQTASTSSSTTRSRGYAIILTVGSGSRAGSVLRINPVSATIEQVGLDYAPLGGRAYANWFATSAHGSTKASSGELTAVSLPHGGTSGTPVTRSSGAATLPKGGTTGGTSATANGTVADNGSHGSTSAKATTVKLLGGMITADTLGVTAQVSLAAGSTPKPTAHATLSHLVIDGKAVSPATAPNTVRQLGTVGHVTINAQHLTNSSASVQALIITLNKTTAGVPAGTTIVIGSAIASFQS